MKRLIYLFSVAGLLMLAACSKDDDQGIGNGNGNGNYNGLSSVGENSSKPSWTEYTEGRKASTPKWTLAEDENPYSSMTAVFALDQKFVKTVSANDRLAAFCQGECVGVTAPQNVAGYGWRFYLYIQQPKSEYFKDISLYYYSDSLKQNFYWIDELTFSKDDIVGDARNPYILSDMKENNGFPESIWTFVFIPEEMVVNWDAGDELAVFCGNTCLKIVTKEDYQFGYFDLDVPSRRYSDKLHARYYSAATRKVYRTKEAASDTVRILFLYFN